jgi:hypothetical protein
MSNKRIDKSLLIILRLLLKREINKVYQAKDIKPRGKKQERERERERKRNRQTDRRRERDIECKR